MEPIVLTAVEPDDTAVAVAIDEMEHLLAHCPSDPRVADILRTLKAECENLFVCEYERVGTSDQGSPLVKGFLKPSPIFLEALAILRAVVGY